MSAASRVEMERLGTQIHRAYEGPSWHGPAVKQVLEGITGEQAQHRHDSAHTIIELVLHIAAWKSIVRSRVLGEPAQEITPEVDWPPSQVDAQAGWDIALARLEKSQAELLRALEGLSDEGLNVALAKTPWTIYDLLHGVVQHDLYHAGQIALLRKFQS